MQPVQVDFEVERPKLELDHQASCESPEKLPDNLILKSSKGETPIKEIEFNDSLNDITPSKAKESSEKPLSSMEKSVLDSDTHRSGQPRTQKKKKVVQDKPSRNYLNTTASWKQKGDDSRNKGHIKSASIKTKHNTK